MQPHELLDPAFREFLASGKDVWSLQTLPAIRARVHATFKTPEQARGESVWTTAHDGERLRLCLYKPDGAPHSTPCSVILYIHGGGFVLGQPEMADDSLADLATQLGVLIVAVDYRLAPEHPFPTPLEDCYTALGWIVAQQHELNVDTGRAVIMGHSAGGGLAAALAILTRDRGAYPIAGQVLIYPMLDHRTGTADSPQRNVTTGVIGWPPQANRFCWDCLRGKQTLDQQQTGLLSPALRADLSDLPPTFISVGALDLFLEEDVAYAMRLSRAGVAVELHVYPGAPHMFDQYPGAITEQSARDVLHALQRMIAKA